MLGFGSLLSLWVLFTAAPSSTVAAPTSTELANITLLLYTGQTTGDYSSVLVGNAADLVNRMDSKKPTVFYIFGWVETPEFRSVTAIVGAYLRRRDHNVVLINWEDIAAKPYPIAAESVESVGKTIATALDNMVAAGLKSSTIHIVGHSLGGQIAGFIGRNVKFVLPRITGLDPAGPGFYIFANPLTYADAVFVDIIHTDAGVYGNAENSGTVNFHPNGGQRIQPGCPRLFVPLDPNDLCSHQRSCYYYAESLLNEDAFVGVSCDSYDQFKSGSCSNETMTMGYATPTTATGNFYLQTNGASPYGRASAGEKYVAS